MDATGSEVGDPARTIGVILNPTAGGGKALKLLPLVIATLRQIDVPHHVHVTAEPGEAVEVARRFVANGLRRLAAVGGDGTLNEVVNGLIAAGGGGSVALAMVPAGRGADFVRSLGVAAGPLRALTRLERAEPRPIDVGRATFADGSSRVVVNVGGVGFDAAVAERAARSRLPGSTLPYLHGLAGAMIGYHHLLADVEADGHRFAGTVCSVVVANGRFFGGGMMIAPEAALDDGQLDLAIVGDFTRFELVRTMPRLYRGTHVSHPKFNQSKARSIRIESRDPVPVQLDGELVGTTPVTFTVVANALRIVE